MDIFIFLMYNVGITFRYFVGKKAMFDSEFKKGKIYR